MAMNELDHPGSNRQSERGVALVLAILFTIIVAGITVAGALALRSHEKHTNTGFVSHGQAIAFARSGLTEALGWFRKQTSQPVVAFNPVLDNVANPPILDTIDPEVGIVREFRITGSMWGRYEVWKDWPGDPDPQRLAWRNQMRVHDVSVARGNLSPGSAWRLRSVGYVFRQVDANRPFNQLPNQIIGQEVADVEVRRLALQPPGQAALCSQRGDLVAVNTRGRIIGGSLGAGVYYPLATGNPVLGGGTITGTPSQSAANGYPTGIEAVFGVGVDELKTMADIVVNNPNEFPATVPMNSLVVCTQPITFTIARPLLGTGVVVFLGNVTIQPGTNTSFSGLVYVSGSFSMRAPADIQGAVVTTGAISLQGVTDFATITYDDGILNALRQNLGTYRLSGATTRPLQRDI
jgi:hypothetical protein